MSSINDLKQKLNQAIPKSRKALIIQKQIANLEASAVTNPEWINLNNKLIESINNLLKSTKQMKGINTMKYNKIVEQLKNTPKIKKEIIVTKKQKLPILYSELQTLKPISKNKKKITKLQDQIMDYVFSKLDTSPNGVNIEFDIPKMNNSLEQVYIIFEAIQNYFSINKNTRGAVGVVTHQQTGDTPKSWTTLNNSNIIKFLDLMIKYLSPGFITRTW